MDDAEDDLDPVSHQDQVGRARPRRPRPRQEGTSRPTACRPTVTAPSRCSVPGVQPSRRRSPAAHPRAGAWLTEEQADAAIAGLHAPNDDARVGGWTRRFLERAACQGHSTVGGLDDRIRRRRCRRSSGRTGAAVVEQG